MSMCSLGSLAPGGLPEPSGTFGPSNSLAFLKSLNPVLPANASVPHRSKSHSCARYHSQGGGACCMISLLSGPAKDDAPVDRHATTALRINFFIYFLLVVARRTVR